MSTFDPGRLVMVDIPGQSLDAQTAKFLREQKIRSVCLFRKNLGTEDEVRTLVRDLIAVLGPEALIGIDQEGGAVVRATFLPQPPSAMALGAGGDAARAEAVGAAVARGLKSLGINWNFAPVLDVNNNPANPVIGERSFSSDPDEVTRLARAWMQGSLAEGVACCVKHFPGHGDTHVDSHHALPTVDKSRAELDALELRPFKALAGEAPAMMTAHIVYPQIDPDRPATLSRALLGGILRRDLGYDGVVITDALMMKAVAERFGYARSAVMAIAAGADMVLAQGSKEEQLVAIHALRDAFADGRLTRAQGENACARLDKLAAAYPARAVDDAAARAADHALMAEAWAAGLTALRGATPHPHSTPPSASSCRATCPPTWSRRPARRAARRWPCSTRSRTPRCRWWTTSPSSTGPRCRRTAVPTCWCPRAGPATAPPRRVGGLTCTLRCGTRTRRWTWPGRRC